MRQQGFLMRKYNLDIFRSLKMLQITNEPFFTW